MRAFVDTNLWVYPLDHREPGKARFVSGWLRRLAETDDILVSTQVLIELRSVLTRKLKSAYTAEGVRTALEVPTHPEMILDAHELAAAEQIPWFDALTAEAALRSGCSLLYSEDFDHEQKLGDTLLVQNPFMAAQDVVGVYAHRSHEEYQRRIEKNARNANERAGP